MADSFGNGGSGAAGVVIITYPTGSITATGGTMTTANGYTIHTFTTSGTFTVTQAPPIVTTATSSQYSIQNLNYTYDAVGNILSITDQGAVNPNSTPIPTTRSIVLLTRRNCAAVLR